ncbi:MAG: hypothetical protein COW03_12075 [Cytophagales bacterium CG12_big_fil_rev_8_21_14_0_65_40_12]|uniref:DUF4290 domain-containing protein n=1 Tax=Roseivirga sp. TaxID=1964215 RepID=UPI000C3527DA|nr:MAG: hypothetical protein COW03_12075 [Cytophagales bacterium CG12_big_fil_rev_8_21_14_0_65_40_12]PIW05036.1 MAG: DUF4290 domain-containing protein [Cytophagales bacterium CG17_big_fil_post_rev_8_21_14_2_50_40_13]
MNLEYNTQREDVIQKEYGRNVQKLVEYIKTVEDQEKRDQYALTLTDLMRQINPNLLRENQEYDQKVWDDLYIMSRFDLEVNSPFPMPEKSSIGKKPQRMAYKTNEIKFRHYGRNLEVMVQRTIEMEDPEAKENGIIHIGRLMKSFFSNWNKDNIEDEVIAQHIHAMSKGQLKVNIEKVKEEGLFNTSTRERRAPSNSSGPSNQNRRKNFTNKRRRS